MSEKDIRVGRTYIGRTVCLRTVSRIFHDGRLIYKTAVYGSDTTTLKEFAEWAEYDASAPPTE